MISLIPSVHFASGFGNQINKYANRLYSCINPTESISDDATTLLEVQGSQLEPKTNGEVKAILLSQRVVFKMPKYIDKFVPNLVLIYWTNGNFTSTTDEDLEQFQLLANSSFNSNQFTTNDGMYTKKLKTLFFGKNQLTNVGLGLMANFDQLEKTFLEENPCIDMIAFSSEQIQKLKEKLECDCPPFSELFAYKLTTPITIQSESGHCTIPVV